MTFSGFPVEGLAFLTDLGSGRDKAWFDERRKRYDTDVVGPAKAFVAAMGDALGERFGAEITAIPRTNGSIAPINNDLRFSPDKTPYKDHLLFRFWEGAEKKTAPTLFVRLSEATVGFASGAALPDLDRWRSLVAGDEGAALATTLERLGAGRALDIDGQGYQRVPKPYPADHPRADLLKHKGFQARWIVDTPDAVHSPGFVDPCTDQLAEAIDVHRWLVTNL